ncbi:unnamed protein product [Lactuca virosa]|uniref:Uncharacterized protein n=1 Tax=Lactuca virosa TaxID=75947 RepID=A0AAU9P4Z9_9ASTR|nr:unnamed protein product [Lactuca virosa]
MIRMRPDDGTLEPSRPPPRLWHALSPSLHQGHHHQKIKNKNEPQNSRYHETALRNPTFVLDNMFIFCNRHAKQLSYVYNNNKQTPLHASTFPKFHKKQPIQMILT